MSYDTVHHEHDGQSYRFVGDFNFDNKHPFLTVQIPMPALIDVIAGVTTGVTVSRSEIIALLRLIARNPETSPRDLEIVKKLLRKI
jgi:hypothetical protein